MTQSEPTIENLQFGRYLRKIREDRRLSLDAVEEMTLSYPERVTKSHLSRIENGKAVPTLPRMFALSQIYGIPISSLAERFEIDLHRVMAPVETPGRTLRQIVEEIEEHKLAGNYLEGLSLSLAALENLRDGAEDGEVGDRELHDKLRLYHIDCLIHVDRFESAKIECEMLLNSDRISESCRLFALLSFVICCYRLKRYTIAEMGLYRAESVFELGDHPPRLKADILAVRGAVQSSMGCVAQAIESFSGAVEIYAELQDPFETCKARLNLAQSLIDADEGAKAMVHVRIALKTAELSGYDKLRSLALSHLALVHYRKRELDSAETYALRSNKIARTRDYFNLVFRNCYYLREIAAGRDERTNVQANERTLNAFLSRVDADLPEAVAYRAERAGGSGS